MRYPKQPEGPETKEEREARLYEGQKIQMKRWEGWAHFGSAGFDLGVREPVEFLDELEQLGDGLIDSPQWCSWWKAVDRPRLTLFCFFTRGQATTRWSRRTVNEVLVNLTFNVDDPQELTRERARDVVTDVFDRMRRNYKLAALPALPATDGGPAEPRGESELDNLGLEDVEGLLRQLEAPEGDPKMPRIWVEEERMYVQCRVCGEVSPGYVSNAGARWFAKHVAAKHPELGVK